MPRFISFLILIIVLGMIASAQTAAPPATSTDDAAQLRQEIEQLKKALSAMEQRLEAQEKLTQAPAPPGTVNVADVAADVHDLEKRVSETEKSTILDRLRFSGDYRFESNSIWGSVSPFFDGMQLQNYVVKTMFYTQGNGFPPASVGDINNYVSANQLQYNLFANTVTFDQIKTAMGSMTPAQQQALMGMLLPATSQPGYSGHNSVLYTNRLRLKFDAKVADNISFVGRLSMYKVFGDSTGVQVFNGQPNSFNIDGNTVGTPNSDILRVERAYFSWNHMGGSKFYLSIGRRPSTGGPPMNYREDELRGGTPSGTLIDYQFDGITLGYNLSDYTHLRVCYGLGYESGWGNGNLLILPQGSLKDTHFLGANFDLWETEKTLFQFTYAHAFNVTDGFDGLISMPINPVNGENLPPGLVMRFTPSANLGSINLAGFNLTRRQGPLDVYGSLNYSGTDPNGITTPFGGLMSDPFETPHNRNGWMMMAGLRYNFGNDERTKLGFEFNHGSQYWFNFAQAQDDIINPKTDTRGEVYEAYLTHRISERFLFKASLEQYNYRYSGSGWHLGAPKLLSANPIIPFPTYDSATMLSLGLIARF